MSGLKAGTDYADETYDGRLVHHLPLNDLGE